MTSIRIDPQIDRPALRSAMADAHMNSRGLATRVGLDPTDMAEWITGNRSLPQETVAEIERLLDVEGMFTGGLDDQPEPAEPSTDASTLEELKAQLTADLPTPSSAPESSPAASAAETVDERDLATATDSADAPAVAPADDASAAGEPHDDAQLDGATSAPEEPREPSDAGEFAAMWNAWDADHRNRFLDGVKHNASMAVKCFQEHREIVAALHEANDARDSLLTRIEDERRQHQTELEAAKAEIESLSDRLSVPKWPAPLVEAGTTTYNIVESVVPPRESILRVVLEELARLDTAEVETLLTAVSTLSKLEAAIL